MTNPNNLQTAAFAGGCFWCTEAIFNRLNGVIKVMPGYTGGHRPNPTYEQVCTGVTGHAEAIQITFDPNIIDYPTLLEIFWNTHNPTTLNQQDYDKGTEYRSAIFYHSTEQQQQAEESKQQLTESKKYADPIVTEIVPAKEFYEAEDYHKNFYENNRNQPYCTIIIDPKIKKLLSNYPEKLKTSTK